MKAILFLVCVLVLFLNANAQSVKPSKDDATIAELRSVYVRFLDASRLKDEKALREIMTDDYSQVLGDGRIRSKEIRIKETMEINLTEDVLELKDFSARVYGDAAVAICRVLDQHLDEGKPHRHDMWSTATFVKQKGKWRIAATHVSVIETK